MQRKVAFDSRIDGTKQERQTQPTDILLQRTNGVAEMMLNEKISKEMVGLWSGERDRALE